MNAYDLAMRPLEALVLRDIRSAVIPCAKGDVLEAGIGTGANFRYYDYKKIRSLTGLDRECSPELERAAGEKFVFSLGSIEEMPFSENSFDCVVATLVLCTVNLEQSVREVQRVLKPGGTFIFIEHVRPAGTFAGKLSDALNRVWPKMAHGCNLNRRTDAVLRQSGFADLRVAWRWGGIFCYGIAKTVPDA